MDELDRIIEEVGISGAVTDIDGYFNYREDQYRKQKLQQYRDTLEEQKALRYRATGGNTP